MCACVCVCICAHKGVAIEVALSAAVVIAGGREADSACIVRGLLLCLWAVRVCACVRVHVCSTASSIIVTAFGMYLREGGGKEELNSW